MRGFGGNRHWRSHETHKAPSLCRRFRSLRPKRSEVEKSQRVKNKKGWDFSTSVEMTLSLICYKQHLVTSTLVERSNQVEKLKWWDFSASVEMTYLNIYFQCTFILFLKSITSILINVYFYWPVNIAYKTRAKYTFNKKTRYFVKRNSKSVNVYFS